jgi:PPOX class probable F420-dependent enzyme
MDITEALEVVRENHRAVLATYRRDGSPQLSPIVVGLEAARSVVTISSRETAVKVKNLRRDPRASVCVFSDAFFGPWVQLDGTARIISLPEAMEPLVGYYRGLSGEHPDWDEYRAAMTRDKRVLVEITVERAGPDVGG